MIELLLRVQRPDEHTTVYMLQALSALRGCQATAGLIEGFADGEFIPRCPGDDCGIEVYVTIKGTAMIASQEDPASETVSRTTEVEPALAGGANADDGWTEENVSGHLAALAEQAGQQKLAALIRLWDGIVHCPKCNTSFPLRYTLLHSAEL